MFPCVPFSEGQKSVNSLVDMPIHGWIESIFNRFKAEKVSTKGDMSVFVNTREQHIERYVNTWSDMVSQEAIGSIF